MKFKENGAKGQRSPVHGRTFVGNNKASFFTQLVTKQFNTAGHFTTGANVQ